MSVLNLQQVKAPQPFICDLRPDPSEPNLETSKFLPKIWNLEKPGLNQTPQRSPASSAVAEVDDGGAVVKVVSGAGVGGERTINAAVGSQLAGPSAPKLQVGVGEPAFYTAVG